MKQIMKRDIYFLFSKKNWMLLLILMIAISIPFIFVHVSSDDYLYTVLGMNLNILDKRYIMIILILNFYMIWLGNLLFMKDLKYSCEFLWLRIKVKNWLICKYIAIFMIFLFLNGLIGIIVSLLKSYFTIDIMTFIMTILITSVIQFFVTIFVIIGMAYLKKSMMYIIVLMYVGAIYFKLPGLNLLFTSTILEQTHMIFVLLFLIGIIYYVMKEKMLLIIEEGVKHD